MAKQQAHCPSRLSEIGNLPYGRLRVCSRVETLGRNGAMLVRYGIVCDRCRKLHFISSDPRSSRIRYDRKRSEFMATCIPPCSNTIYFQRGMLMPYLVPDQ